MSQSSAPMNPGYITQLNALRGFAALSVVVYHVHLKILHTGHSSFLFLFERGYLAVDMFFILSGFVLMLVYSQHATWGKLNLYSYLSFISKRCARIFPVHWLVLSVLFLLECTKYLPFVYKKLDALSLPFSSEKSIYSLLTNIFLIQNWGLNNGFTWNVPAWSISAEWFTYLLAPLLMIGLNFFKEGSKPILGWLLFNVMLITSVLILSASRHASLDIGYNGGNLRMFIEFLMGGCLCLVYMQLKHSGFKGFDWLALAAGLGIIVLQLSGAPDLAFPALLSLLILCVALSTQKVRHILSHNSLFYLGEISFSLYLVHQIFVTTLGKLLHLGSFPVNLTYLVACLVLSTLSAHYMYNWVELPVREFLNTRFSRWLAPLKQAKTAPSKTLSA
jgi:peptidoglycan/LPS O-acetylase OafA/YrhL